MEIRQSELRKDNAVSMRRVAADESFVVTVNGRRVADVVPHRRDTGRRQFVPAAEACAALTQTPIAKHEAQQWWQDTRDDADQPEDPWERQAGRR